MTAYGSTLFYTLTSGYPVAAAAITGLSLSTAVDSGASGFSSTGNGITISSSSGTPRAYILDTSTNPESVFSCDVVSAGSQLANCVDVTNGAALGRGNRAIAITGSTAFITNNGDNTVTWCTVSSGLLNNCGTSTNAQVPQLGGYSCPSGIAIDGSTAFIVFSCVNQVYSCTVDTSTTPSTLTGCVDSGALLPGSFVPPLPPVNPGTASDIAIAGGTAFVTMQDSGGAAKVYSCTVVTSTTPSTLTNCRDSGATVLDNPTIITLI